MFLWRGACCIIPLMLCSKSSNVRCGKSSHSWSQSMGYNVEFLPFILTSVRLVSYLPCNSIRTLTSTVNMSEADFARKKNKFLPKIHEWVQAHGGEPMIPFSAAFENKIFDMPADEEEKYCKQAGVISMLPKV